MFLLLLLLPGAMFAQAPAAPQWFPGPPYQGEWRVSFTEGQDEGIKISIQSEPEGAEVFLNEFRIGATPIQNFTRSTGPLKIQLVREGYLPSSILLNALQKGHYHLSVRLEPAWAKLEVEGWTEGVVLRIDDQQIEASRSIRIAPGPNRLVFRRFGYTDIVHNLKAEPLQTYKVSLEWTPAPFELVAGEPSRSLINPKLPGNLGLFSWPFQVTAPGDARLSIVSKQSESEVLRVDLPALETWEQRAEFRPAEDLPDGVYLARLDARGKDGREYTLEILFQVDSSLRFSPVFHWTEPSFFPPQTFSAQTSLGWYLVPDSPFEFLLDLRFSIGDWEPQVKLGLRTGNRPSELYAGLRVLGPKIFLNKSFEVFWGVEAGQNFSNFLTSGFFGGQPAGAALLAGALLWSDLGPFLTVSGRGGVLFPEFIPYLSPRLALGWAAPRGQLGLGLDYNPARDPIWEVAAWFNFLLLDTNLSLGANALARFADPEDLRWKIALQLGFLP